MRSFFYKSVAAHWSFGGLFSNLSSRVSTLFYGDPQLKAVGAIFRLEDFRQAAQRLTHAREAAYERNPDVDLTQRPLDRASDKLDRYDDNLLALERNTRNCLHSPILSAREPNGDIILNIPSHMIRFLNPSMGSFSKTENAIFRISKDGVVTRLGETPEIKFEVVTLSSILNKTKSPFFVNVSDQTFATQAVCRVPLVNILYDLGPFHNLSGSEKETIARLYGVDLKEGPDALSLFDESGLPIYLEMGTYDTAHTSIPLPSGAKRHDTVVTLGSDGSVLPLKIVDIRMGAGGVEVAILGPEDESNGLTLSSGFLLGLVAMTPIVQTMERVREGGPAKIDPQDRELRHAAAQEQFALVHGAVQGIYDVVSTTFANGVEYANGLMEALMKPSISPPSITDKAVGMAAGVAAGVALHVPAVGGVLSVLLMLSSHSNAQDVTVTPTPETNGTTTDPFIEVVEPLKPAFEQLIAAALLSQASPHTIAQPSFQNATEMCTLSHAANVTACSIHLTSLDTLPPQVLLTMVLNFNDACIQGGHPEIFRDMVGHILDTQGQVLGVYDSVENVNIYIGRLIALKDLPQALTGESFKDFFGRGIMPVTPPPPPPPPSPPGQPGSSGSTTSVTVPAVAGSVGGFVALLTIGVLVWIKTHNRNKVGASPGDLGNPKLIMHELALEGFEGRRFLSSELDVTARAHEGIRLDDATVDEWDVDTSTLSAAEAIVNIVDAQLSVQTNIAGVENKLKELMGFAPDFVFPPTNEAFLEMIKANLSCIPTLNTLEFRVALDRALDTSISDQLKGMLIKRICLAIRDYHTGERIKQWLPNADVDLRPPITCVKDVRTGHRDQSSVATPYEYNRTAMELLFSAAFVAHPESIAFARQYPTVQSFFEGIQARVDNDDVRFAKRPAIGSSPDRGTEWNWILHTIFYNDSDQPNNNLLAVRAHASVLTTPGNSVEAFNAMMRLLFIADARYRIETSGSRITRVGHSTVPRPTTAALHGQGGSPASPREGSTDINEIFIQVGSLPTPVMANPFELETHEIGYEPTPQVLRHPVPHSTVIPVLPVTPSFARVTRPVVPIVVGPPVATSTPVRQGDMDMDISDETFV